ncbi:MAG: type I-C CRISPR-associated endonuclease Cas1 [Clostridia bacterium]|nr:type I-C CRISPR-associated endonuclease Cas1 [Clostridia bacterium]
MRKLLNTLYITTNDYYLSVSNENVVVNQKETVVARFPLLNLEGIVTFSYAGASPALMGECAQRGIQLVFMTPNGRFLARVNGMSQGNVLLRREQYRIAECDSKSTLVARNMITGKIFNCRWVLERVMRDHALRIDQAKVSGAAERMKQTLKQIQTVDCLDSLRGLEGEAALSYFSVFDELILSQKADFIFDGRNRHPPQDNVNAMLSFAYTLLANDCASALESVGLDAYVGFMHRDRPGRKSLALDIEEELRAPFADRMVLTQINNRVIQDKHFDRQENGTVLLNEDGRKLFLNYWQEKKRDAITHPYLKEKIPWGLVPYVQALLLSRFIRKDIDEYPPFLWK